MEFKDKSEWLKDRGYECRQWRISFDESDADAWEFRIVIEMGGLRYYGALDPYAVHNMDLDALERYDNEIWRNARTSLQNQIKEMREHQHG